MCRRMLTGASVAIIVGLGGAGTSAAQNCSGAVTTSISGSLNDWSASDTRIQGRVQRLTMAKLSPEERALVQAKENSLLRDQALFKYTTAQLSVAVEQYLKAHRGALVQAWSKKVRETCGAGVSSSWRRAASKNASCTHNMATDMVACTAGAVPAGVRKKG